ncbi:transcription factor TFIIIB subunit brf1 [Marasmius crinis-equi]|uniref:B-related factor 1 n=1 Tax=Marasmius crinis-equi TaxID=585013 RepID=A0ABR3FDH9_9AGAR
MAICTDCGGTVIEYDAAAGNGFCVKCGTVVEENTIVNEVSFGETSSGAAMVQGSYVGQGASRAKLSGPFGNRGNSESREQTIANGNAPDAIDLKASKRIQTIANIMRLSEVVCMAATRLYTLAVEHKFTKGRKSLNVVAVCLYVACRQKETRNYMLIDFSDLLQVNVFELGHTYLQLVQTLNLRLPLVDPSHYISRFAALLEFGDETQRVATDAVRLVQRFDRDWMTRGRRPAGICGAALLLAARMNNFRRSVEEIVQVVKIADTTLKKRLDEFKNTPSGSLTLADFRNVWLEEEMDPPAYTKGKEREEAERLAKEQGESGIEPSKDKEKKGKTKKKGRKRKRGEEEEPGPDADADAEGDPEVPAVDLETAQAEGSSAGRIPIDPVLLNEGILAGTIQTPGIAVPPCEPLFLPDIDENIDPELRQHSGMVLDQSPTEETSSRLEPPPTSEFDETVSSALAQEVAHFLENNEGTQMTDALDERERERLARINDHVDDDLLGLDEEELDRFLLTDEEVKIKERVWVELNRDYLEALAAKGDPSTSSTSKSRKRRKTNNKPRDTTTPHGATTAESVRNLIKKNPKYSKRINYDALKDLFVDPGPSPFDDKDDGLYTMDDKDDKDDGDATLVVIEDDPGGLMPPPRPPREPEPEGEDDDKGDEDEDVPMGNWDDGYEQEV